MNSITINVLADADLSLYFEFGSQPGVYTRETSLTNLVAGRPLELNIGLLQANTRCYYRLRYLPAFFFVAISGPLIPRLRASPLASAFLDALNVASLALMAVVTWQLGQAAVVDIFTVILALAGAVLLLRYKVSSAWLVLGGALLGFLSHRLGG